MKNVLENVLYNLQLSFGCFDLIEIKTKKSIYVVKVTEKVTSIFGDEEIKVTEFHNKLFHDAVERFTYEVKKRIGYDIHEISLTK